MPVLSREIHPLVTEIVLIEAEPGFKYSIPYLATFDIAVIHPERAFHNIEQEHDQKTPGAAQVKRKARAKLFSKDSSLGDTHNAGLSGFILEKASE